MQPTRPSCAAIRAHLWEGPSQHFALISFRGLAACTPPGWLHYVAAMQNDVVPVTIKGVMPTANGCAVFLGNEDKTFVIYVDHSVGNAIQMTLSGVKKDPVR